MIVSDKDGKVLKEIEKISEKGNHAEVKKNKDGDWVIYEVKKKKTKVG